MNCRRARLALTDARRGRVRPSRARALEEHLSRCPSCGEEARFEAEIAAAFAALKNEPMDRIELADAIAGRLRAMEMPGRGRTSWLPLLAAAASAFAGFGLLVGLALVWEPTAAAALRDSVLLRKLASATLTCSAWLVALLSAGVKVLLDVAVAAAVFLSRHELALRGTAGATSAAVFLATLVLLASEIARSPRGSRRPESEP